MDPESEQLERRMLRTLRWVQIAVLAVGLLTLVMAFAVPNLYFVRLNLVTAGVFDLGCVGFSVLMLKLRKLRDRGPCDRASQPNPEKSPELK